MDETIELLLEDAREHMAKALEHLRLDLNTLRAGRAVPQMLDGVRVEAYGSQTPLNQVASVSAPQADLLVVQPWDRTTLNAIEKAIRAANLGLNPGNDGSIIRIPVPTPTEERRRDLVKQAKNKGEEAKVSIRGVRRSAKDDIKKSTAELNLSEDVERGAEEDLQKLTDQHTARVDEILAAKEVEIMQV